MIHKNSVILLISFLIVVILSCSSSNGIAGGTTDSGNTRIQAKVLYGEKLISGAVIRIRPADYIASDGENNTNNIIDTITDDSGCFAVDIKQNGSYVIEIVKNDTLAVVSNLIVDSNDKTYYSGIFNLARTGALHGSLTELLPIKSLVKIKGLERQTVIKDGNFIFPNLAQGEYTIVFESEQGHFTTISDVPAVSGKISRIININLTDSAFQIIMPDTYQADSISIQSFLDSQNIAVSYLFTEITDTASGRIRTLNLAGLQISKLHLSIGSCDFLFTLNLSNNQLTTLPTQIEGCRLLSALIAENNVITSIPVEISRLRFLEFLKLNYNRLESVPDSIYLMPKLRKLAIGDNPIDSLPAIIGNLKKLEQLDIFSCNLKRIPEEIGNLINLNQIWANNNALTSLPESIIKLGNLEILQLNSNMISMLPNDIGLMNNLRELHLYSNKLKTLPVSIINLTRLHSINIDKNNICELSDELIQWVENQTDPDWLSRQNSCQ